MKNLNYSKISDLSKEETLLIDGGVLPIIAGAAILKGFGIGFGIVLLALSPVIKKLMHGVDKELNN